MREERNTLAPAVLEEVAEQMAAFQGRLAISQKAIVEVLTPMLEEAVLELKRDGRGISDLYVEATKNRVTLRFGGRPGMAVTPMDTPRMCVEVGWDGALEFWCSTSWTQLGPAKDVSLPRGGDTDLESEAWAFALKFMAAAEVNYRKLRSTDPTVA